MQKKSSFKSPSYKENQAEVWVWGELGETSLTSRKQGSRKELTKQWFRTCNGHSLLFWEKYSSKDFLWGPTTKPYFSLLATTVDLRKWPELCLSCHKTHLAAKLDPAFRTGPLKMAVRNWRLESRNSWSLETLALRARKFSSKEKPQLPSPSECAVIK